MWIREHAMTKYESNDAVQPARITTYRSLRKAARRGWAVDDPSTEPSLTDLRWPNGRRGVSTPGHR
jgi:hypothetical protein